jgi:hypothetical protein
MTKSQELSCNSRSDLYLRATRLVFDLHQRAAFDIPALLGELIEGAVELVPGAQHAGVMVTQRRHLSDTAAATHRYPVLMDEIQNRCQQGPGLTAGALQESIPVDDLVGDDRWPLYRQETLKQNQPSASMPRLPTPSMRVGQSELDIRHPHRAGVEHDAARSAIPLRSGFTRCHWPGQGQDDGTVQY